MKSVVQEASSIGKAIEQGWKAAGEPRQFSVKILELPQKNFFGFTSRLAKIAIIFDESSHPTASPARERRERVQSKEGERPRRERDESRRPQERFAQTGAPAPRRRERPAEQEKPETTKVAAQNQGSAPLIPPALSIDAPAARERRPDGQWDADLVTEARKWLTEVLALMNFSGVQFNIEIQHYFLRITLSQKLLDDETKEKYLFASLSTLMLATLKRQSRKALRGHKIVLVHD